MRIALKGLLGITLATCSVNANATVFAKFSGIFQTGSLTGEAFTGSISYNTKGSYEYYGSDQTTYYESFPFGVTIKAQSFAPSDMETYVTNDGANDSIVFYGPNVPGVIKLSFLGGDAIRNGALPGGSNLLNFNQVRFDFDSPFYGTGSSDNVTITAVPELGTWAFLLLGFGLIGGMLRRRRNQPATSTVSRV